MRIVCISKKLHFEEISDAVFSRSVTAMEVQCVDSPGKACPMYERQTLLPRISHSTRQPVMEVGLVHHVHQPAT
eukprot:10744387-Ditylum_brightwellii.AAC.1